VSERRAGRPARSPRHWDWALTCRRLAVGWAVAVFVLAVVPVSWVFGVAPVDVWTRLGALGHYFEFALLTGLVAVGWRDAIGRRRALAVGAAVSAVYGVVIEIVQLPLPYRHFDVRDMATDWAGVATAALLVSVASRAAAAR
jgi:VanZ family protein